MDKSLTQRQIEINSASAFSKPVHAVYRGGETVRLTHVGDATGMSPVYLAIDSTGASAWVPQKDVIITDLDFLPLGQEALDNLGRQFTGSGNSGSSGSSGSTSRSAQPVG